jgi:Tfp pilus assembly protein PilN
LYTPVAKTVSFLGSMDLIGNHLDWIQRVLGNPLGAWLPTIIGFLLLIWINYGRHKENSQTTGVLQTEPSKQASPEKEKEQLKKKLLIVEQDRDRLRARLADPTAKRQHTDKMLRSRCLEVAHELQNFMSGRAYTDSNETVVAFNQRHEWKVSKLRDELDKQAWLTLQERDILTFRADDYSHKIKDIAETLRSIGMGH